MTITPYTSPLPSPVSAQVDYQSRAVANLREWAASADAAYLVAERLVQSSFVPAQFRGKPVEACAAMLAGAEVGLSPMAAVRSFDVIQGVAAPRAITLRAIAQSFGHEFILVESTNTRCILRGRRKGATEWQTITWTIDRAQSLGLVTKDNWKKQPGAMLVARATSELARLIAADAILGIGYSAEEIEDGAPMGAPQEPAQETPPESATRRMSRTSRRRGSPSTEDVQDVNVAPDEDPGLAITDAQRRAIFAAFAAAGFTTDATTDEGRKPRLAYMSQVLGRPVDSTNDLTMRDASAVLDALRQDAGDALTAASSAGEPA